MELSPHVAALRADLSAAAAIGSDEVSRAAALLGDALEPALRLVLLDLLSEAADELADQLGGATVEVRLRGREPELVASLPVPEPTAPATVEPAEDGTARLTLRLPEALKTRVEGVAGAEGVSVNSWLVRAVASALEPRHLPPFPGGRPGGPRRLQGYGRA